MKPRHFWKYVVPTGFAAATLLLAPQAGAQESVEIAPLDSAAVVDQVRTEAANYGIAIQSVDPALTDAIDAAVNQFIPQSVQSLIDESVVPQAYAESVDVPATNPEPLGSVDQPAPLAQRDVSGPNYWVRDDIVSKTLAQKPFEDYVVNRVPGSTFDAPHIPAESDEAMARGNSLYGPGTPIYVGDGSLCTMTVTGTDADGRKIGITAAHCGQVGDAVTSADSWEVGPSGTIVHANPNLDYAVVELGSNAEITSNYNNVHATSIGGTAQPGEIVCKTGVATNETCGMTLTVDQIKQVNQVCSMTGDSGAPLYLGGRVVGMVNGGIMPVPLNVSCQSPWQGVLHTPTASVRMDAVLNDINASGAPGRGLVLPEN
ncbi:S1 family peptidase [Corynebacterium sp. S7]